MYKVFLIIGMSFIFLFVGFSAVDIGEANDVIYACKHKDEGMLRMVKDHSYCRVSEEPVSWHSTQLGACPCWTPEDLVDAAVEWDESGCIDRGRAGFDSRTVVLGIIPPGTLSDRSVIDTGYNDLGLGVGEYYCDVNLVFPDQTPVQVFHTGISEGEMSRCREILVNSQLWSLNCYVN